MTDTDKARSADDAAHATQQSRLGRLMRYIPLIAPVLLWTVPCVVLLYTGQHWPLPVALGGTALFVLGLVAMPLAMARGHGRRQQDWAAIVGDTLLGGSWILFTWSVLVGIVLRLALTVAACGRRPGSGTDRHLGGPGRGSRAARLGIRRGAPRTARAAGSTYNSPAWAPDWTAPGSP